MDWNDCNLYYDGGNGIDVGSLTQVFDLLLTHQRAPTAGGQYHWVAMLAPPSCRKFLSYITGERYTVEMGEMKKLISGRLVDNLRMASSPSRRRLPDRHSDRRIDPAQSRRIRA